MDPTRTIRILLVSVTATLIALGVVMIYSASAIYADQRYGDSMYFLKRHAISLSLGCALALGLMAVDYRLIRRLTPAILVVAFLGLAVLLVPQWAVTGGGARRWIGFFGLHIQPSEFVKIAVVFFLADWLARRPAGFARFKEDLLKPLAVIGVLGLLILLQPDLGSVAAIGGIFLIVVFAGRVRLRYFAWLAASACVLFALAIIFEPYRLRRIMAFTHPWEDLRGAGFQLWQSFLALGSGGWTGVGLGQSQQKLFYLPAAHTDFIFSIIGEELGFLGAGLVILFFAGFAVCGFLIVFRCSNVYGRTLSLGLVSLVVMEAAINIGVSVGALPTKGLALPFISYGGSAVIAKLMCVGLLLNISRDAKGSRPWYRF